MAARPGGMSRISKYALYQSVAQNPAGIVQFMTSVAQMRGVEARKMREDFCGTGLISLEWARAARANTGVMIDIVEEPVAWGRAHNYWTADELNRVAAVVADSTQREDASDVTCALNFSWCALRDDDAALAYFKLAKETSQVLVLDHYGGADARSVREWHTPLPQGGAYTWEHVAWDDASREVRAAMHFALPHDTFRSAFEYHWKLRPCGDVQALLRAAGFTHIDAWMEDRDAQGNGTGHIRRITLDEDPDLPYWTLFITAS